jgi:hypothetical protein
MESARLQSIDNARKTIGVGNAKLVHYWMRLDIRLTPVDVTDLDTLGIRQWRMAAGRLMCRESDTITDIDLVRIHGNVTTIKKEDNVNPFKRHKPNSFPINRPYYTLYVEERKGVLMGMVYYENTSVSKNSMHYDTSYCPDGSMTISACHFHGFLLISDKKIHESFIHNDKVYIILFFDPHTGGSTVIELPVYEACIGSITDDDETSKILSSVLAKHTVSVYLAKMDSILELAR